MGTYKTLVEKNVKSWHRTSFNFYQHFPYKIVATISRVNGVGIEFTPSNTKSFEARVVDERVETAIFKISPFRLTEEGALLLEDLSVQNVPCYHTILKGSNRLENWSEKAAVNDASDHFRSAFMGAFVNSEEFRQFVASPELSKIAKRILEKFDQNKYTDDFMEFKKDFAELYDIAEKYNIKREFADELYNFLEKKKNWPTWAARHPVYFGLTITLIGGLLIWLAGVIVKFIAAGLRT
jgi:hypothetical protein